MFQGSAWFLHCLIKHYFGNKASKSRVSPFSGSYSRYSFAVTTKLINLQGNTPYITITICLTSTWPKMYLVYIQWTKKILELETSIEVPPNFFFETYWWHLLYMYMDIYVRCRVVVFIFYFNNHFLQNILICKRSNGLDRVSLFLHEC